MADRPNITIAPARAMRETRLTRHARAAIAHYARAGYRLGWHPEPFAFLTIRPDGRRLVYHDEWERTQPVTERMRELLRPAA